MTAKQMAGAEWSSAQQPLSLLLQEYCTFPVIANWNRRGQWVRIQLEQTLSRNLEQTNYLKKQRTDASLSE